MHVCKVSWVFESLKHVCIDVLNIQIAFFNTVKFLSVNTGPFLIATIFGSETFLKVNFAYCCKLRWISAECW